ncbi:family 16 glycosylhydrolase [Kribbella sp. NPDC056861]|uniref:family 16 glycosylhydrolase n=1 Tax=Kribbella sp. NPDC056861 TaxID=3154857 RepID=UPI00343162D9
MRLTSSPRIWTAAVVAAGAAVLAAAVIQGPADADVNAPQAVAGTVWEDNFDGPAGQAPNSGKWRYDLGGGGWGNAERQYYTNSTRNSALDGAGHLVITARRESGGKQCHYGTCEYTSARLLTAQTFTQKYGRFEARLKLPRTQGIWPAFWMLGDGGQTWPNNGELDIMENIGREPSTVHGTIHGPGYSGGGGIGGAYSLPNGGKFSDGFHTFTVDWAPDSITWYVDGKQYQRRTPADLGGRNWVFNHPFFMILNVAVGGSWPGYPDGSTQMPQSMTVDYVRVSSLGSSGGGQPGGSGQQINGIAGKCLDVAGSGTTNGTKVQIWDCNGTGAQKWIRAGDGTIRALGKCLDIANSSTANGATVRLWDCNGSPGQQWAYSGAQDIVNPAADKCLDVANNSSTSGARVQLWRCVGTPNQKWRM